MDIVFHKQLAFSENYPDSNYPMSPQNGNIRIIPESGDSAFIKRGLFFSYGRYAILKALLLADICENCAILMPSYHCRSMIEPAIYLGLKILFYPVNENLNPNIDAIREIIEQSAYPIKAIFVVHYFGFIQEFSEISSLGTENGIIIIEDCAHAYYDLSEGSKSGTKGDFSIASPRKFFPIEDGGILLDNRNDRITTKLKKAKNKLEIKSVLRMVQKKFNIITKQEKISKRIFHEKNFKIEIISNSEDQPEKQDKLKYFDPAFAENQGLRLSKWLIRHACHRDICIKRRENYLEWLSKVKNMEACKPLYPVLPDMVVPYVFPLILSKMPLSVFHALKNAGIPMLRWEDSAVTGCQVSEQYRLSLVQLPCHQELSKKQLRDMTNILGVIMNKVEKL